MKKVLSAALLALLFIGLTSMAAHKFYVAIFQINYAPEKKMLQITSRIFVEDLDHMLQKKYGKPFHLGEKEETPEQVALMQKYLLDHLAIKIDGKPKAIVYLSKEMENNVLICYFRITDITKISSFEIENKILFDFVTEQQNIIQTNINGQKTSLLLTPDNPVGNLKY